MRTGRHALRFTLRTVRFALRLGAAAAVWTMAPCAVVAQVNAVAAESLARKSGCLKCHSLTQKKDAPSYKEVAVKYKGKPDAEQKLAAFISTGPKIKVDGKEEEHDALKTKSDAEIKNVAAWILSQ